MSQLPYVMATSRFAHYLKIMQRDKLGSFRERGELEREGLVAVTATGRAVVSRLTREDFEEIYAARMGLEGLAARDEERRVRLPVGVVADEALAGGDRPVDVGEDHRQLAVAGRAGLNLGAGGRPAHAGVALGAAAPSRVQTDSGPMVRTSATESWT